MMDKVKLGDCCVKIGSGATPKGGASVYIDSGTSFIRSQNVYNMHFDFEGLCHINEDAAIKLNGVTVFPEDILLNITGDSVARCCIVPDVVLPARVSQHVSIVRPDKTKILPKYLLYYLCSPFMQATMLGVAVGKGASRNAMTKGMIEGFEVPCPSLSEQQRIISQLEPFDAIIENSQKQIALLEEAAQRLYKEWFIDFRFPGHEDTLIENGVPEGWAFQSLLDVFDYVRGKSYSSSELSDNSGTLMVNLKNIRAFGGYKRNEEKRFTGDYKESQTLAPGDVVMGVTDMTQERRLVGHVAMIPDMKEPMTFSMDIIKLIPKTVTRNFLYSACFYGGFSKQISPLANGVNVLHLKPEAMMSLQMLVPSQKLIEQYDKVFEPIRCRIETLQNQCILVEEARNRLLPNLMSGNNND